MWFIFVFFILCRQKRHSLRMKNSSAMIIAREREKRCTGDTSASSGSGDYQNQVENEPESGVIFEERTVLWEYWRENSIFQKWENSKVRKLQMNITRNSKNILEIPEKCFELNMEFTNETSFWKKSSVKILNIILNSEYFE